MKAVIMAGGSGTRLRPLTCDIPKPMVTVLNRPVMEHIINLLKREGITEIAVTTYYLPQSIKEYFGDGGRWGVNLHYYHEKSPLGTAGSVQNAADFLDETFIVISGDAVTDFNLARAAAFHQEMGAEATLVLTRVNIPLDYGVVIIDENYRITSFLEKPAWSQVFSDTINTGIYILEPDIFNYYKAGVKYDFSKDLFPLMLKAEKKLYGLPLSGYWNDIGTVKDYYETNRSFMLGEINLPLPECHQPVAGIWLEDGVEVHPTASLTAPVFIGKDSRIAEKAQISSSVIGENSLINNYSSVKNSLLWNNTVIGRNNEIRGSVIADKVKLEDEVSIFDRTVLGKGCRIAKNSIVRPGIKIWPEKSIKKNSEVTESLFAHSSWQTTLFSGEKIKGKENIDITSAFMSKLAASLSSVLPVGAEIVLNGDGSKVAKAYKLILAGSLISSGNNVIDLGSLNKSVLRFNIYKLQVDCGLHISFNEINNDISFEILDSRGINISEQKMKSIEKIFFTEKYRLRKGEVGEYSHLPGRYREYAKTIYNNIDFENIKRKYFNIVCKDEKNYLHSLGKILKKLNCQVSIQHIEKNVKENERIIKQQGTDLYLEFIEDGERVLIYDEKMRRIDGPLQKLLISVILIDRGEKKLYIPVSYPRVIENYAQKKDAQVVYTRSSKRAPLDIYHRERLQEEKNIKNYINPFYDGFYTLLLILEKMASTDRKLSEIVDELPDLYYRKAEINCDWEEKGRVMRILAEEADNKKDLIDGVRFEHDEGWALILPDGEKPVFHIMVEGGDMESAESLTGYYLKKLKNIIEN